MEIMQINYQQAVDMYVQMLAVAMPLGLIWALLEKLVVMFYDAVCDRWDHKRGL